MLQAMNDQDKYDETVPDADWDEYEDWLDSLWHEEHQDELNAERELAAIEADMIYGPHEELPW